MSKPSHVEPLPETTLAAFTGTDPTTPLEVLPEQEQVQEDSNTPSRFDRLLGWISSTLGIDKAVAFTILARSWSSLAGIVTLTLIAHSLSPAEQGYYYTFYSLVALQVIFELGFSVVILQTASHEAAHLTIHSDGTITGPEPAHARLASVLQKSVRWYTAAAILLVIFLLPVGIHFFSVQSAKHPEANPVSWFFPWLLVVLATSCTFQLDPTFSFLEGCGYVSNVARTRLTQVMLGSSLGWTALLLHHGLFAPGLIILGQAIAGSFYVIHKRHLLIPLFRRSVGDYRINWGAEIWPFQWRIAVSWLCGYFTFQIFNPILFAYRGPVEAGQMGMSMNICGTLSALTISWMNTKSAPFGRMIALRDFNLLDSVFFRTLVQSTTAAVLACSGVWAATLFLRAHHIRFALRLLPPLPFALLLIATIANIVVFGFAIYLRAHKQEKFMWNSIAGALSIAPAAFIFGRSYGALGIAVTYFLATIFIGVGSGSYTFLKYRKLWHG
ncbi:MAG TPA: hypothetical protein VFE38_04785 [Edaphobacter sp.]|nr:hypothetical protein [Edaphobacter sp.]